MKHCYAYCFINLALVESQIFSCPVITSEDAPQKIRVVYPFYLWFNRVVARLPPWCELSCHPIRCRPCSTDFFDRAFILELCQDALQCSLAHAGVSVHDFAFGCGAYEPGEENPGGFFVACGGGDYLEPAVELLVASGYYAEHVDDERNVVVSPSYQAAELAARAS